MKHRLLLMALAFGIGLGGLVLLMGGMIHQARAMSAIHAWHQVGGDGLGDPGNYQIPSLVVFGDYLYAGTWNWHTNQTTKTAQIWRTMDGTDWGKVDAREVDGTAAMVVFSNTLYAASWNGYIWSSSNGSLWTEVITDGFGTPGQGIARFMPFGNKLYASTWNGETGTEVWRTSNGTDWDQFIDEGLDQNKNNASVISSEVYDGYLYMGVTNDATGAQLWRTAGITTTAVMTDGFKDPANWGISSLAMFKDMLYAGTYNEASVQVWRTGNAKVWQKIDFAFGNPSTNGENALEVFEGQLYLAVADYTHGMQVWRTSDGMQWERVASSGFGDAGNHNPYWDNGMTVFKDKLYVGTINWQNAGEIWQLGDPISFFLPLLRK
jgi:hypothetical protein